MKNFIFIIFVLYIHYNYAHIYNKLRKCENCSRYIKGNNINNGMCKLFTNNSNKQITYNLARDCRENEFLCGFNGWL